jgi:tRNA pseudouridine55 synthase
VNGVLAVDKPAGPTSFEVVARVRRALGGVRAGHAGTLDPAATGLLAVCLGDGLKLQQFLVEGDKAYEATVAFGAATDTEDAEGRVVETGDASALDAGAVRAALPRFVGEILQTPPMYSAVRVGGRRLHEAARAGEAVERVPRRVRVDGLELLEFEGALPGGGARARLAVRCGKGTYVRTLAADLGRALGVPAHLAALRRTRASGLDVAQAIGLEALERLAAEDRDAPRARVLSMADALAFLPAVTLDAAEAAALAHGQKVEPQRGADLPPATAAAAAAPPLVRALAPDGRLVAVCTWAAPALRPLRVVLGAGALGPEGGGAGQDR